MTRSGTRPFFNATREYAAGSLVLTRCPRLLEWFIWGKKEGPLRSEQFLEANIQGRPSISAGEHTTIADALRNAAFPEGAQYVEVLWPAFETETVLNANYPSGLLPAALPRTDSIGARQMATRNKTSVKCWALFGRSATYSRHWKSGSCLIVPSRHARESVG